MVLTLTFLVGLFQIGLGLARLGSLVNFVSHSVILGFTAGAAIRIATSQMQHLTGIKLQKGHYFVHIWTELIPRLSETNLYVLAVALITLLIAQQILRGQQCYALLSHRSPIPRSYFCSRDSRTLDARPRMEKGF